MLYDVQKVVTYFFQLDKFRVPASINDLPVYGSSRLIDYPEMVISCNVEISDMFQRIRKLYEFLSLVGKIAESPVIHSAENILSVVHSDKEAILPDGDVLILEEKPFKFPGGPRSDERRLGKAGVRPCRFRWSP